MDITGSDLTEAARDILTELGNIGAGNAATSLSVMLDSKIEMSIPEVKVCDFDGLENLVGNPEEIVASVFSIISGGFDAIIAFLLTVDDAKKFVKLALKDDTLWNSDMGVSAINEISNILIGSYAAALETLTETKIRYSLPEACIDMAGAVLSVPCIEYCQMSDKSLIISSDLIVGDYKIDGHLFLISYSNSYDILLQKLGIGGTNE